MPLPCVVHGAQVQGGDGAAHLDECLVDVDDTVHDFGVFQLAVVVAGPVEGLVEVLLLEEGVEDSEVVLDLCRFLLGVVVGVRDRVAQRVFDFTGCQDLKNGLHVLERERHFVLFEVIDLRDGTEHRVVVATEGHEHLRADLHILIRNVIKRAHHAFRFNGAITIDVHWLPPWVCLLPAL